MLVEDDFDLERMPGVIIRMITVNTDKKIELTLIFCFVRRLDIILFLS